MKREDFIFTVGYSGETAIIDKAARKQYAKLSTRELLEKGLFKPAFCSALYDNDEKGLQGVLEAVNSTEERQYGSVHELKRLFGVFQVPEDGIKAKQL